MSSMRAKSHKVVHFVSSMDQGGIQKVVAMVSSNTVEFFENIIVSKRVRPWVFAVADQVERVELFPRNNGSLPMAVLRLRRFLRKVKPTVIVAHGNRNGPVAVLAALCLVTRVVIVEHSVSTDLVSRPYRLLRFILYPFASRVLVISTDQIRSYPYAKVRYMPNPVSLPRKSVINVASHDQLRVAFVGRLHSVKRVDHILMAVACAKRSIPITLEIVGAGPEEDSLRSVADQLSLRDSVIFHGWLKDPGLVLAKCQLLALTSKYEGFPMAVIEAMAMGVIPVAYRTSGGISDLIFEKRNGRLLDEEEPELLGQVFIELFRDAEQRSALSKAAFRSAQQYGIDNVARKWKKMIERISLS